MFKFLLLFALLASGFANSNSNFETCCKRKNLPDQCQSACTYNLPSQCPVPISPICHKPRTSKIDDICETTEVVASYIQCLQNEKDNRECCKEGNVDTKFPYCLDLCDGTQRISGVEIYAQCQKQGIRDRVVECGKRA